MASALGRIVGRKNRNATPQLSDGMPGQSSSAITTGLSGTLIVTILRAERLPLEKRHSGSMHCDPYVELTVDGSTSQPQVLRTATRKKTICPEWNQQIIFNQVDHVDYLIVRVKDKAKNKRVKDCIAFTSLDLHQLIDGTEHNLELPLEPEGTLYLSVVFQDASNLFGLPLADVCRREQRPIPHIITKCVEEIQRRGLTEVGVYRTGGNARITEQLKQAFIHRAEDADVSPAAAPTIASVASLLKQYLRELPEPLITAALYPAFMRAAGEQETQDHRLRFLQGTIESMPKQHRDCFKYLFDHFLEVISCSEANLMTAEALATCLGPTLFTLAELDRPALNHDDVQRQNAITQFLLEHWEEVRAEIEPPSLPTSPQEKPSQHPRAVVVRNASVRSRRSIDTGRALVSPSPKSLHAIARHVWESTRRRRAASGVLSPEEVSELCTQLDIANSAEGKTLTFDEFHTMLDQAAVEESKTTARVRAHSVAQMQQRWEHHAEVEAGYVMKAASSFARFAESQAEKLTAEEFRSLCFDLGLYVVGNDDFNSLSNHSSTISKQTFLSWWKYNGKFLATVHGSTASSRLLTQFIALWQYLDDSSIGQLTITKFNMLHADLLAYNYGNLPQSPTLCMKLIQAAALEATPDMLTSSPPKPTVTFNDTLRWLLNMDAFARGETALDSVPTRV
eukprot:m.219388 g.219388  ORF g.219388 m.219388 type:complete len:680 (+) comp17232_c0_seq3:135-2174(+)